VTILIGLKLILVYFNHFYVIKRSKQKLNLSHPFKKGSPKVMPILLRWPATLEADAGGMAVEVEPSQ
jgi:hypothetical protein